MSIGACTGGVVTPGVVVFDPTAFIADYPSFATISTTALQFNFSLATLYLNNSCCSVVQDAPTRAVLLNLVTAHITALLNGVNGQPPTGVVGRISAATQGSVSAQTEWSTVITDTEAFWNQTTWGTMFWTATAPYRTARYIAPQWGGIAGMSPWESWPQ